MKNYKSNLPTQNIVDDSNWRDYVPDDRRMSRRGDFAGYVPRDYHKEGVASGRFASEFDLPLIPQNEWEERIQERERTGSTLLALCKHYGLTPLDQGMTNYCWANGPVHACEIAGAIQSGRVVRLSAASVAGPATNYANIRPRRGAVGVGGWGKQALDYIAEHGVVEQKYWKPNDPDPSQDNGVSRENRKRHRCLEWYDLPPRSLDHLVTALLSNFATPVAYMWMSHLVCAIDPVIIRPGQIGILCANSGYGRDANGFTVLTGNKMIPDEQVAPRVVTAI